MIIFDISIPFPFYAPVVAPSLLNCLEMWINTWNEKKKSLLLQKN